MCQRTTRLILFILDFHQRAVAVASLVACYTQQTPHAHPGSLHRPRNFSSCATGPHRLHFCFFRSTACPAHGASRPPLRLERPTHKTFPLPVSGRVCIYSTHVHPRRRSPRSWPHVG